MNQCSQTRHPVKLIDMTALQMTVSTAVLSCSHVSQHEVTFDKNIVLFIHVLTPNLT